MAKKLHSTRIAIIPLFFALTLAGIVPASVSAQDADTDTVVATTTEETAPTPKPKPAYTLERVQADKVFGDFVVGPGKSELSLAPGESGKVELIVTNRTGETKKFNFEIEDITGSQDPNQAVILLGDDQGPYTLKDYIQLPEESVTLEHNQRARIPVTIAIPADAEPGGRYGSVLVNTVSIEGVAGDNISTAPQSAIISRIGTLFFVVIEGGVEAEGKVQDFTTLPAKKWFSGGPIRFGIYFENTGSVHLNPYGELRVMNFFGEEVGFTEIEPWFALPQSLRFREIQWNREFLFGRYTATVNINRGYDDVVDTMSYTFWVLPWKILGLGILGIFIVLFIIRAFFRKFEFKRKT